MSDTAATIDVVPPVGGRSFPNAQARQHARHFARTIGGNVLRGVGAVAALGALIVTVTVAAAWIVNSALVTKPEMQARTLVGPGALMLANGAPPLIKTADTSFESKWGGASTGGMPLMAAQTTEDAAKPLIAKPFIEKAPAATHVAKLIAAPARIPLPPRRMAEQAPSIAPSPARSATPLPPARPQVAQLAQLEPFGPPIEKFTPQPIAPQIASQPAPKVSPQVAMVTPPQTPPVAEKRAAPVQEAHNKSAYPELDSRTAIYDISARTVFLPSGQKLEAHSGLYDKIDDPKYVHVRMRGATPPNVYDLTLRAQLFHGVRAIRLNPVDGRKMFGRDGMLAHTYMLGPNGQSNGCVSFKDYDKFLQAFLKGEIDRLVVVPDGGTKLALVVRERRWQGGRYAANDAVPVHGDRMW
jgi:hypothetical protein